MNINNTISALNDCCLKNSKQNVRFVKNLSIFNKFTAVQYFF